MDQITVPAEGQRELIEYVMSSPDIPEDVMAHLRILALQTPSSPKACADAAELIYARADELPPELLELGAQLASMLASFDMFGMGQRGNHRGYAISATLRKMPGVESKPPSPSKIKAPEPLESLLPTPPAEEPPAPEDAPTPGEEPPAEE